MAVALLAGCGSHDDPSLLSPSGVRFSEAISPYTIAYLSRSYDSEGNTTTFYYQLQNTGSPGTPASGVLGLFTNVVIEVPECAGEILSASPPNGATIYQSPATNANGLSGVEWGVGYDINPSYNYSITFSGDVPAGTVRGMVSTGGLLYVQSSLTGACAGVGGNQVAGTVFTDVDGDGAMDANEFGVPDVTVKLSDGESSQTFRTDADGNYVFLVDSGTFTVSIDSVTADSDFNETLFQLWNPTSPISIEVTVGPDSFDNDFGFEPDAEAILAGVEDGTYPSAGKSYKWWRKEFLRALNGTEPVAYTPSELLDFAQQVENLALLNEYDWTPGQELQQVYNILNNHAFPGSGDDSSIEIQNGKYNGRQDAWNFLLRELLTWELNVVSGRALSNPVLESVLVNWGEGVLNTYRPNGPPAAVSGGANLNYEVLPGTGASALRDPLETGGIIYKGLNGATGGGGTGN